MLLRCTASKNRRHERATGDGSEAPGRVARLRRVVRLFALQIGTILLLAGAGGPNTLRAQESDRTVLLTIDEAIARALERNNQVRAAYFATQKAKWDRRNAWTQLLPVITFNTRFTWIDDSTFALRDFSRYFQDPNLPFSVPQTVFQSSYYTSFDVTMPIFNGALFNGLAIARENVQMTSRLSESTRESIIFQVVSSYLRVLKSKEILKLQREYLELSRLNYEKAERMHRAGRYSKTEALRWKVDYQQQKSTVVNSESVLRSEMSLLSRLVNLDPVAEMQVSAEMPERLLEESRKLAARSDAHILQMIRLSDHELLKLNAALAAAKANQNMSRLFYRNSYASYLPNVSLSYNYAWRENNTFALDDYSPKTFMLNVSVPLFTSFQNLTSVKSAYYEYKQTQEDYYDQIRSTRLTLTEIANQLINLKTQNELHKTEVELSEYNYRVVEQQKGRGLVSNIEFIDAKLNLQNARLNAINTQYDFIAAMVQLYYFLGRIRSLIH